MMKKLTVLNLAMLISVASFSQINIRASLDENYRDFMVKSHSQFSKNLLEDFTGQGGTDRFLNDKWQQGAVTNNYGTKISDNFLFNFDFMEQELHAKWKDSAIIVNCNYVSKFYIISDLPHYFVKEPLLDPVGKYFYESIGYDDSKTYVPAVQLLKLRTIIKLKANKDDYLNNFNGNYSDVYKSTIYYYLVIQGKVATIVKLTKKDLIESLGNYKQKAFAFFAKGAKMNEQTAATLIYYLNNEKP